jgi:hypothetical protein
MCYRRTRFLAARTGANGWMPAVAGRWRKGMDRRSVAHLPLTAEVIAAHLVGDAFMSMTTVKAHVSSEPSTHNTRRPRGQPGTPTNLHERTATGRPFRALATHNHDHVPGEPIGASRLKLKLLPVCSIPGRLRGRAGTDPSGDGGWNRARARHRCG